MIPITRASKTRLKLTDIIFSNKKTKNIKNKIKIKFQKMKYLVSTFITIFFIFHKIVDLMFLELTVGCLQAKVC